MAVHLQHRVKKRVYEANIYIILGKGLGGWANGFRWHVIRECVRVASKWAYNRKWKTCLKAELNIAFVTLIIIGVNVSAHVLKLIFAQ